MARPNKIEEKLKGNSERERKREWESSTEARIFWAGWLAKKHKWHPKSCYNSCIWFRFFSSCSNILREFCCSSCNTLCLNECVCMSAQIQWFEMLTSVFLLATLHSLSLFLILSISLRFSFPSVHYFALFPMLFHTFVLESMCCVVGIFTRNMYVSAPGYQTVEWLAHNQTHMYTCVQYAASTYGPVNFCRFPKMRSDTFVW